MAFSNFDLLKGIDFTALANAAAADHNTLVDAATPITDTALEGKSINLWSVDSALNTPSVPNPVPLAVTRWVHYIWIRYPHASAADTTPIIYVWNANVASGALLRWVRITVDLSAILALIAAQDADIDAANTTAVNAQTIAGQAAATANTALTTATNAETTANNANANVNTALTTANNAQTAATNAETTANTAITTATTAKTTADATAATLASLNLTPVTFGPYPIVAGTPITVAHGYATLPKIAIWNFVCVTAVGGFAVGDRISIESWHSDPDGTENQYPAAIGGANATQVFFNLHPEGANGWYVTRKDTGATLQITGVTLPNWQVECCMIHF